MNFDTCTIYKRKKIKAVLPCRYVKKTDLHDEYFLIHNHESIKPGYILSINNQEKFYVTDVRLHHSQDTHIEVYFETVAQHKEKIISKKKVNISLCIASLSLVVSIIALVKSFFTK